MSEGLFYCGWWPQCGCGPGLCKKGDWEKHGEQASTPPRSFFQFLPPESDREPAIASVTDGLWYRNLRWNKLPHADFWQWCSSQHRKADWKVSKSFLLIDRSVTIIYIHEEIWQKYRPCLIHTTCSETAVDIYK